MIDWILLGALVLIALSGIVLAVFQLPGTWLILVSAAGYDWHYGWQRIGWKWLGGVGGAGGDGGAAGDAGVTRRRETRRGQSPRAAIGALLGGLAGMILLSVPVPVIGTVIGGLLGCFAGALIGEISSPQRPCRGGKRSGVFATLGRLVSVSWPRPRPALAIAGGTVLLAFRSAWCEGSARKKTPAGIGGGVSRNPTMSPCSAGSAVGMRYRYTAPHGPSSSASADARRAAQPPLSVAQDLGQRGLLKEGLEQVGDFLAGSVHGALNSRRQTLDRPLAATRCS